MQHPSTETSRVGVRDDKTKYCDCDFTVFVFVLSNVEDVNYKVQNSRTFLGQYFERTGCRPIIILLR